MSSRAIKRRASIEDALCRAEGEAAHLYAKGLISSSERDDAVYKMHSEGDRMDWLLLAVEKAIRIDKMNFYTFLDILDKVSKYKYLVHNIRDTLPAPPQSP